MGKVTFVTSNTNKAKYLQMCIGIDIDHKKVELDEIQSLDVKEIVKHKLFQAYEKIKAPVIVEDSSLEFEWLWWLPWPFIKFFIERISLENICKMLNWLSRKAKAKSITWYYDGKNLELFEWCLTWEISEKPVWEKWYDRDKIFISDLYKKTNASLSEEEYKNVTVSIKSYENLKSFLENIKS